MADVDFAQVAALADELRAAGPKVVRASSAMMSDIAGTLRSEAAAAAPRDTGELAGSVYVRGTAGTRKVGSDVRQGFFQEFGTSVMAPQPWLWPAARKAEDRLFTELRDLGDPFN